LASIGCWVGTQPDRGSDLGDIEATQVHPGTRQGRGNLFAKFVGDEVVITGQSSAWITGAPVAQTGFVSCQCDDGDGLWNDRGGLNYIAALVPFDKGVTKGKPLDKMRQRPLPQGEIFFNDVVIPKKDVIAGKDTSYGAFFGALTFANMEMALTFTGVARAAFEHALAYAHEREQSRTQLINHQSVRQRLFDIWRKVETARAIAHRVVNYNYGPNGPYVLGSRPLPGCRPPGRVGGDRGARRQRQGAMAPDSFRRRPAPDRHQFPAGGVVWPVPARTGAEPPALHGNPPHPRK